MGVIHAAINFQYLDTVPKLSHPLTRSHQVNTHCRVSKVFFGCVSAMGTLEALALSHYMTIFTKIWAEGFLILTYNLPSSHEIVRVREDLTKILRKMKRYSTSYKIYIVYYV